MAEKRLYMVYDGRAIHDTSDAIVHFTTHSRFDALGILDSFADVVCYSYPLNSQGQYNADAEQLEFYRFGDDFFDVES